MYNTLKSIIGTYKLQIYIFITLNICASSLSIISPYLNGKYLDILTTNISLNNIYFFVCIYLLIRITNVFFSYMVGILTLKLKSKIAFNITSYFVDYFYNIPLKFFQNYDPVYISQRINSDASNLTEFIVSDVYQLFISFFYIMAVSCMVIYIDYKIFLILCVAGIFYTIMYKLFKNKINESSLSYFESQNNYSSVVNEPFKFSKTIKINSLQNIFNLRLNNGFNSFLTSLLNYGKVTYLYNELEQVLETIFITTILFICGLEVLSKNMSIGQLTIILSYFTLVLNSLGYILNFGKRYQEYKVCYNRFEEFLSIDQESLGSEKLDCINKITFKDFRYLEGDNIVIDNLNYSFESGNIYTILGSNGCGKSTLLYLISKVINHDSGNLYFNNIDSESIDFNHLRKHHISFLEQEPTLIKDSFYNNLTYNVENDNLLEQYLDLFNLNACFSKFENGINSMLSDNIENLSGGEKQKIGLVKTFLKNSSLIILDEPTSALDFNSSEILKKLLLDIKKDKIIIIVTHDKRLRNISDFVLEFKDNKICCSQ